MKDIHIRHPITKAALSKYEKGKSTPSQTFLVQLGQVLGVKASYFLTEPRAKIEWLAFRKLQKLSVERQEQIKAHASGIVEGQLWLQSLLYPDEIPHFPQPVKACSLEKAEYTAQK